ncbi:hypothetical protein D3C75_403000 [compost metagenome]
MNKFKRLIKKAGLEEMKSSLLQAQLIDFMSVQNYYQNFESIVGITKLPIFSVQDSFNGSDSEIIKHIIQNDNNVFTYLWTNNVGQLGNPTIDENEIKQNIEIELQSANQFILTINPSNFQTQIASDFEVVDFDGSTWDDDEPRDKIIYYLKSNVTMGENIYQNEAAQEGSRKAIERFINSNFGVDEKYTECFIDNSSLHTILDTYAKADLFAIEIEPGPGMTEKDVERVKRRHEEEEIDLIVSQIRNLNSPLKIAAEIERLVGRNAIIEYAVENSEIEYVDK